MSTATAVQPLVGARVQPTLAPVRETHPRHIEIVTTKSQRRARPKVVHAVITLGALFGIFAAQLLLSIAVSDGAYQIAALQQTQKELSRTEAALAEDLAVFGSTQNLVANAAALGMTIATAPMYLNLADGAVFAAPPGEIRYGCATMCNTATNALTTGLPLVKPPAATGTPTGTPTGTAAGAAPGATAPGAATPPAGQATPPATPSGPTTDQLPAPVTR